MIDQSVHNKLREVYNPDGSDLRWLQMQLLDVLIAFDHFCREHKITYSLAYGTLLGAVRHEGFIPWDDDVDMIMTRAEWTALKQYIRKDGYLTEEIRIQEVVHPEVFLKLGPIDIFIIDYAPRSVFLDWIKGTICMMLCVLIKCKSRILLHSFKRPKPWFVFIPLAWLFPMNKMVEWKDAVAQWFTPETIQKEHKARTYASDPQSLKWLYQYGMFMEEKIDVEFEGHKFMSIPQYDAFLRENYGDYMQIPKHPTNLGRVTGRELCDIR